MAEMTLANKGEQVKLFYRRVGADTPLIDYFVLYETQKCELNPEYIIRTLKSSDPQREIEMYRSWVESVASQKDVYRGAERLW